MEDSNYYGGVAQQQQDDFVKIQEWLRYCRYKWHWFVISLGIMLTLAVAYIVTQMPQYTRQASVLVKQDKSSSLSSDFSALSFGISGGRTNLYNEMLTFCSPSYMYDVVKRLNLDMNYSMKGRFHDKVLYGKSLPIKVSFQDVGENDFAAMTIDFEKPNKILLSNFKGVNIEDVDKKKVSGTINSLFETPIGRVLVTLTNTNPEEYPEEQIKVYRQGLSDATTSYSARLKADIPELKASVIQLSFVDSSPLRAEDVLNTLFDVYNQKWVDDINEQAVSTSKFIDEELQQIVADLGSVDDDISEFKSRNMVPDVAANASISLQRAEYNSKELMDLSNQLFMARYIRKQLSDEASKYKVLPANSGIDNQSVGNQILSYNEKLNQRNNLIANSGANNPIVNELEQSLTATRQAIVASLDNVIAVLNNRIADIKGSQASTKGQIASTPSQAKYLLSVERQQKVKEQLYIFLLQKKEENQLSKAFTAYNTKMLNPPAGSKRPSKPVKFNIMMVALTIGLLIPFLLVFLMVNMDNVIHTRKDMEMLSIPFVGEIPLGYKRHAGLLSFLNKRKEIRQIVVKEKSGNTINEAFRVLRTNLEFISGKDNGCRTMMLTSSFPHSGKTFVSANLGMSFAIKDKKVLVIDLDMRKSSLSTFVNKPALGIADYLSENISEIDDIIVRGKLHPNLDVIPVGTTPPNPTELLFSERLEKVVASMNSRYDFILIDCPPLDVVADASIINKLCDMTIFVIRAGLFNKMLLPDVEKLYQEKRYNNMVVVLNGTYEDRPGYGNSYGYGYGYGYGAGYGYYSKK